MTRRFRKLIQRPNWTPPMAVWVEITYNGDREEVSYGPDEELTGGVFDYSWRVVGVHGPVGEYFDPESFEIAVEGLVAEPDFAQQIVDYCLQDMADREPCPWPHNDI